MNMGLKNDYLSMPPFDTGQDNLKRLFLIYLLIVCGTHASMFIIVRLAVAMAAVLVGEEQEEELPGEERQPDQNERRPGDPGTCQEQHREARDQEPERRQLGRGETLQADLRGDEGQAPDHRGQGGQGDVARPHLPSRGGGSVAPSPTPMQRCGADRRVPELD